jgi:hypothetical protein
MRRPQAAAAIAVSAALYAAGEWNARFLDVAPQSGLTGKNVYGGQLRKEYILETTGNGVAIFDYDGDGAEDLFFANGTTLKAKPGEAGRPQLYHNDGKGHFTDVAAKAGLTQAGWGQGVCAGDFDNDGHTDLLVTYYGVNRLLRNRGNGTFEDATAKAGLPVTGVRYGSGCTFFDYDRDGWLDLFVSNYVDSKIETAPRPGQSAFCEWKGLAVMCGPRGLPLASNVLYRNDGHGRFTDLSAAAGILKPGGRYSLGAVAADFDGDGWPDLYVACDAVASLLFHNRHDGTFEERGVEAGVAYNFDGRAQAGMGVAVADYDGDGRLDIAKTNFLGDLTSLFHNDDGRFFTDVAREAGLGAQQLLGWGVAFVDVDDDGWKDLVIANGHVYPEVTGAHIGEEYYQPTVLFRNSANGKFRDVTAVSGPAFAVRRAARGLAVGDLDGDGRPEIVVLNMNAAPSLLRNAAPAAGQFLNVRLTGRKSNRSAIGARVAVVAGGRTMIDEVMSGGSYYSQNSFTLHFGLGAAGAADRVEVRWPNGDVQRWTRVPGSRTVRITEGEDKIE